MHPFLRHTIFVHIMYSTKFDQEWPIKKSGLRQKICPVCQRLLANAPAERLGFGPVRFRRLSREEAGHKQSMNVLRLVFLLGVRPQEVHQWFLAIYVDAIAWVEVPNVLGMSQYADGGLLASKPYVASGQYLQRMGGHCPRCPYRPERATGADACPFTTLYWDFLQRHWEPFRKHPRTALQWRNLEHKSADELAAIRAQAAELRQRFAETEA